MNTFLGLILIALFIICVIVLAAAATWIVVKLSPAKSAKKPQPPTPETP